jgi:hypothetical protein
VGGSTSVRPYTVTHSISSGTVLRHRVRVAVRPRRNHGLFEPVYRFPHLRPDLAAWFYCGVSIISCIYGRKVANSTYDCSPLIGGTFSNPADQYPRWFTAAFWREFPYFLPGAIAAGVSVLAVLFGYMFLKEVRSCHTTLFTSIFDLVASDCKDFHACTRAAVASKGQQQAPLVRNHHSNSL